MPNPPLRATGKTIWGFPFCLILAPFCLLLPCQTMVKSSCSEECGVGPFPMSSRPLPQGGGQWTGIFVVLPVLRRHFWAVRLILPPPYTWARWVQPRFRSWPYAPLGRLNAVPSTHPHPPPRQAGKKLDLHSLIPHPVRCLSIGNYSNPNFGAFSIGQRVHWVDSELDGVVVDFVCKGVLERMAAK